MPAPRKYLTDEERRLGKLATNARYHASPKGQAAMVRANSSEKAKERYARYRLTEKYQAAQERFKATGGRNSLAMKHRAILIEEHPEKLAAWNAVQAARRSGLLPKPRICSRCGWTKHLVAHHHLGYEPEHWMDVQWLCRPCHKAAHS